MLPELLQATPCCSSDLVADLKARPLASLCLAHLSVGRQQVVLDTGRQDGVDGMWRPPACRHHSGPSATIRQAACCRQTAVCSTFKQQYTIRSSNDSKHSSSSVEASLANSPHARSDASGRSPGLIANLIQAWLHLHHVVATVLHQVHGPQMTPCLPTMQMTPCLPTMQLPDRKCKLELETWGNTFTAAMSDVRLPFLWPSESWRLGSQRMANEM